MILAVSIVSDLTGIVHQDSVFRFAVVSVMVPAVHLGVVDPAALPWCPPWAAEEAVSPNTGQMEAIKMLP